VPEGLPGTLTTRPYYRSTYVFVSRADRGIAVSSLDDPALRTLAVGVPVVGGDAAGTPPALALARRGIVANVRGFTLTGDYAKESPPAALLEAVLDGSIDIAIAWGPLAGAVARRASGALVLRPVPEDPRAPDLPFAWDIALGVRRGDTARRDALDSALERHAAEIGRILDDFGVPRAPRTGAP
jgi:mxaJ protein